MAAVPAPVAVSSPLFRELVRDLDPELHYRVLDCGPARAATVAFFSRYSCRLRIADLPGSGLMEFDPDSTEPAALAALIDHWLPPGGDGERFDLILCWDLPNYLGREALRALGTRLGQLAGRGTRLHMFIGSQREIPSRPMRFDLRDDGAMELSMPEPTLHPAPRYSQTELMKLMPAFGNWRAVLLQNGLQEYVCRP